MANDDAWSQGWGQGAGAAQKRKDKPSSPVKQITTSDGQTITPSAPMKAMPAAYKKGGKVKKTGVAKVHKGEYVLTAKQAKKYGKKKTHNRKRVASKA